MALPPVDTNNETFVREVDEGLRQDQMVDIWRKWGRWIMGGGVLALAAFGGVLLFQEQAARGSGKVGEQYDAAIAEVSAGRGAKTLPELDKLAASNKTGYRALARFAEAGLLVEKNDLKGAAAKYGEIAGDAKLDKPFREFALLRQTAAEYETLKPQVVVNRLKEMAVPESAWFASAGEMVAVAYLKQGKRDQAGRLFAQIAKTEAAPASVRQRAVQMANLFGADTAGQSGEKKAQ